MSATAVTGTLGGGQTYVGSGGGRVMIFHLKMRLTLRSVPTQQLAVIRECALVTPYTLQALNIKAATFSILHHVVY